MAPFFLPFLVAEPRWQADYLRIPTFHQNPCHLLRTGIFMFTFLNCVYLTAANSSKIFPKMAFVLLIDWHLVADKMLLVRIRNLVLVQAKGWIHTALDPSPWNRHLTLQTSSCLPADRYMSWCCGFFGKIVLTPGLGDRYRAPCLEHLGKMATGKVGHQSLWTFLTNPSNVPTILSQKKPRGIPYWEDRSQEPSWHILDEPLCRQIMLDRSRNKLQKIKVSSPSTTCPNFCLIGLEESFYNLPVRSW